MSANVLQIMSTSAKDAFQRSRAIQIQNITSTTKIFARAGMDSTRKTIFARKMALSATRLNFSYATLVPVIASVWTDTRKMKIDSAFLARENQAI